MKEYLIKYHYSDRAGNFEASILSGPFMGNGGGAKERFLSGVISKYRKLVVIDSITEVD